MAAFSLKPIGHTRLKAQSSTTELRPIRLNMPRSYVFTTLSHLLSFFVLTKFDPTFDITYLSGSGPLIASFLAKDIA